MVSYCTYKNYLAKYDDSAYTLTLVHTPTGATSELVIDGLYLDGEKAIEMSEFSRCGVSHTFDSENAVRDMMLTFACSVNAKLWNSRPKRICRPFRLVSPYPQSR